MAPSTLEAHIGCPHAQRLLRHVGVHVVVPPARLERVGEDHIVVMRLSLALLHFGNFRTLGVVVHAAAQKL